MVDQAKQTLDLAKKRRHLHPSKAQQRQAEQAKREVYRTRYSVSPSKNSPPAQVSPRRKTLKRQDSRGYTANRQISRSDTTNRQDLHSEAKQRRVLRGNAERRSDQRTERPNATSQSVSAPEQRAISQSNWQNPLVTYLSRKYANWQFKHVKPSRVKRTERRILVMLAFFSIAVGLWENFRQLWLQDNGFTANDVSNAISFGTLISMVGVMLISNFVRAERLKRFMLLTLVACCLNYIFLAVLNHTGLTILIYLGVTIDILTSALFLIGIYPLITMIVKGNTIYSRRKLVEYLFKDVGILLGGIFIGQQIGGLIFDYNTCLVVAFLAILIATLIMWRIEITPTQTAPAQRTSIKRVIKLVFKDRLQRNYMIYCFLTNVAWSAAMGLKMLSLTDSFGFSAGIATNYVLVVGLIADFIGIIALKFLTPKNDYLTLTIKYGIRVAVLTVAMLSESMFLCFIAFTWMILSSTAYENITDGYYVNLVDNRHQFQYNTLRHVISGLGTALGVFICGKMFDFGPGAMFGVAAIGVVLQLMISYYLIYLRMRKVKRGLPRLR